MILGMCIGVLDEKIGPVSVYQLSLSKELSKKLIMKVMIGVMSFSTDIDEKSLRGESIIPFAKEKIITFAYLFPVKDPKARGGFRQSSIILAFDLSDRKSIYENATELSLQLIRTSELIELKHIQSKKFPSSISEMYDQIREKISLKKKSPISDKKSKIELVCPQCNKNKEIEFSIMAKGVKLIEHQVFEKEICDHSFVVYIDSKFNVLGYKDPKIELSDMKKMFGKLKSPYD